MLKFNQIIKSKELNFSNNYNEFIGTSEKFEFKFINEI